MLVDSGRLLVHMRLGSRPERARRAGGLSARAFASRCRHV